MSQTINNYYCPHRNNINKIIINLSKTKDYLTEKTNIFNNNYINKFDLYLNNYISLVQSLYNNLYDYYEGKINNYDNIKSILNDYQIIFNDLLIKYSNEKIFERINKEFNISNTNIYLNKLENNIIKIKESYFNNYYLIDSKDFLEYPEEIIFKIEEISEILKENNEMIKNKINYIYKKKILNIFGSTKIFINNINDFNFQYIMNHININNIIQRYYIFKHNQIKAYFNSYSNKLNEVFDNNIITAGLNEQILNENNYDYYIYKILNNYTNFLSFFEEIIKENFTIKNCSELLINNSINKNFENNYLNINESNLTEMNYSNITECSYEKYKTNLNYSKYNFNIIKLRTEISYTKRIIEKFYSLFDDLNYKNIIDFNQINQIDKYTNNKNILLIYNETSYKLNEIKNDGLFLIEEPFEEFVHFFQIKSTLENEYMPFFYDFEKLLKYENNNYKNNITEHNNKILDNIYNLLEKFNQTLYLQTLLKNNYDYYSLNHYYYESIYNYYYSLLKNCFDKYKQKIKQLKNNTSFYNILKKNLDKLQINKRIFLENLINNYSLNYEYESIGFTYNLSKDLISFLKKEYIDYEFSFIYDYYELFDKYSIKYSEKIIEEISLLQNNVEKKLKSIYEQFLKIYTNDIHYTSNEYINEIKINYTNCINYHINLNNEITQDLNNSNITELEDFINNNCSINKIIDYLLNNTNDSTCLNLSEINSTIYYNEVYNILNCYSNNNYNYSVIIFDDFDDIYKDILDNIIINITKEIESNYIDEIYLNNFFQKYCINYTFEEIALDDLYTNFEDIEDMIYYINNYKEPEYRKFLFNLLIESFNLSLKDILNNYIINELIDQIRLFVNDKIDIYIEFFISKVKSQYNYYLLLLNNTEELGYSSKMAIINLYSNLTKKINESLYYIIREDVLFNINLLFRENKNLFINNFIKYYLNNNEYGIDIYKINKYMDEIKLDVNFNKTLSQISSNLINNILYMLNNSIINNFDEKLNSLYNIVNNISDNIQYIVENISINQLPEDMEKMNELIINYNILVENQNNRYNFIVGEKPFTLLNQFIETELEPPLFLIKEKYDEIEQKLLSEIKIIADNFPDCYSTVKENIILSRIEKVEMYLNDINLTIIKYKNELIEDIGSYINKLIHYSYINGLYTFDQPCNEPYCSIPKKKEENSTNRRLNKENNKRRKVTNNGFILNNYSTINKTKIKEQINKNVNFKRKLEGFSPSMGALSEDDILYYLLQLQDTLLKFNKTYLGTEFNNINKTVSKFLTKINITYLEKLKRSFTMKLVKFSTILTDKSLKNLDNILCKQYYQIEAYIHQSSYFIKNQINNYIISVNNTSLFIEFISYIIYNKVIGYYEIIYNTIQSKFELVNQKKLRGLYKYDCHNFETIHGKTYNFILKSHKYLEGKIESSINNKNSSVLMSLISWLGENISKFYDIADKIFYHPIQNYSEPLPLMHFPPFPFLQLRLIPNIFLGTQLDLAFQFKDTHIGLDLYAKAEVSLSFEAGIYIPPSGKSTLEISISTGLRGILGSGKAGIKLYFRFRTLKFVLDLYYELDVLTLSFYVKYRISIKVFKKPFVFESDIYNLLLLGYREEFHKTSENKFKSSYIKSIGNFPHRPKEYTEE